ncbi:serine/threonine protein kinase [Paludibacter propionicigenes WB4]|uniref:Serine/threonine protein kinase n=1 Tax=Paludibacter propionicigenes (strain DSM 17365 / JCM 13257 / WB4) TaxID=694427 RepID=E4T2V6_PALPW|nr:protein kinase family protein [Paludibacter propionicigenes]ADQ79050.1 serine/threonine protein kinase [Paludibacter propionicigenes WB4]
MKSNIIEFLRKKDFRFESNIGQGGTGKTVLLKDELINELFVCKKYSPYYKSDKEKYFKNFVDEIKILHSLFHLNLVRVFNYYLYPELHTGYILMEYIKGIQISDFIRNNPERINSVFTQTIDGFRYLEENKILHRDIRPDNILVSEKGVVKIIDFGFGKIIEFDDKFNKSISLNWRYSTPNEFSLEIYDFKTEVYFVGKLFEEIIKENDIENLKYTQILNKMINPKYDERIHSFFDVSREILSDCSNSIYFTDDEKQVYQIFAGRLVEIFSKICDDSEYISNLDTIIMELETIYRNSILEDEIQNPTRIASCFIKGQYYYNKNIRFYVENLESFIRMMKSSSFDRKKIILNNLWQRLDRIKRYPKESNSDLPF